MMTLLIIIILAVFALGVGQFVRRQIRISRQQLKSVDRSKLKNLDDDAWGQEEQDD